MKFWHTKLKKHTNKTTQQTLKPYSQILRLVEIPSQYAKLITDISQYPAVFRFFMPGMASLAAPPALSYQIPLSLPPFSVGVTYVLVSSLAVLSGFFLPASVAVITKVCYGIKGSLVG